jgi:hypothetical protein
MVLKEAFVGHGSILSFFLFLLLRYCLSLWMVGTSTLKERVRDCYDRLVDFFFSPSSSVYHMLLLAQIACLMAAGPVHLPIQVGRVVQSEDLCI